MCVHSLGQSMFAVVTEETHPQYSLTCVYHQLDASSVGAALIPITHLDDMLIGFLYAVPRHSHIDSMLAESAKVTVHRKFRR
jgi:hypothetical protein